MEKITNIEIKNFKSIRHQTIEGCKRINVFVGPPNVGKSNILEALSLFGVLLKGENFSLEDIIRSKHLSELFFNLNYRETADIVFNDRFSLTLESDYSAAEVKLRFKTRNDKSEKFKSIYGNEFKLAIHNNLIFENAFTGYIEDVLSLSPIRKYQFKSDTKYYAKNTIPLSIPFGNNLLDVLQRESELRKSMFSLFSSYGLQVLIDKEHESILIIKVLDGSIGFKIPFHLVADTLQRLVFNKAVILSNKNSILLLEEPESHMFPPYISKFTSDIIHDENNNQYFIATHSPYVLNDLMEDAKEDLAIFLVGYKNGETLIHKLSGDDMHEAYQFGYDFFLNMNNFMPTDTHEKV